MQKNAPSTVGNKDARTLISDYGSRLNKIEQNQKASAAAVSKTYTTAADYKAKAGSGVTKKPAGATTAADYKASGKGIENTYGKETLPKVQKETPVYTPSFAQKVRTNIGNNIANRTTSTKTAPEYDIFLTPAQKAKNAVGQGVANRYNEGEKWLTTDDGTDYFAKGFVNRLRSTGGKAVEDLAYFLKDAGNNSVANSYSPGEEITLENREAARLNAMRNNTDWLRQNAEKVVEENRAGEIGDIASQQMAQAQENADTWLGKQLVMAGDSTATMLGYMLLPGGKTHLAAYMGAGGGLNEYREQRENGASEEEAQVRGITSGAISYLVESMGGIGAGGGQKIPGIGTIGKKLDELATKNFFTSVLSNAMDEGGEELVEYVADYVANCIADKMFKGEIQTEFNISEMFQNALTGAIVGGGFGAVKASPEIASTAKDIVEAVKNGKAIESVQTQQEAPAGEVLEQAANIPTETKTEQEAPFASPTEKTFEQRAEELYKQGKSWGEIGKILQAEYHPDWEVDNVKKEARNYIRKSDFYGEKGIPKPEEKTIDNGKGEEYNQGESGYAIIAPYFDRQVSGSEDVAKAQAEAVEAKLGGFFNGTDYQPTQSKLLYAGDRADVYRKGLERGLSETGREQGLRDYYLSAQSANEALRNRQRQINKQAENEAGAESPGFSDGQNSLDYSALQNITNTLYGEPDAENKDIYAPFYPKDNRPEGNTVGAKQSTTPFWAAGGQYGTYEPKARQTYEGNELFEAPKRLSNDGKQEVSEAVQSVAASPIGTTETLDYMIQNIDKFTHAVDTDVESVTKAKDYLETNGLENSVKYWKKIVDGKSKYTKDDGVLAATTIRLLQKQGRQTEANEMTAELVAEISTAAQATQGAEAIYKILDPANMNVATNSEYYIKHLTEKLNEKHKGQLKGKEIKADQKLLEEALAANGTEKQGEAWDKVYANIANQVPATFWEKFNNIRYFCMLSNPRTHIRNTVSNLAMYGISGVKDGIKSVVEAAYNNTKAVKSGKAEESRTASVKRAPKEYREFAKEDFKAVRNVNETGKYSEQTGSFVSANRTKINDNILLGAIKARFKGDSKTEAVINKILDQGVFNSLAEFNSYMLGEVEDGGAKSMIYTRAMSQYMQANNLTPEFLKSDAGAADLQKARAYASAEALYNTFNEANGLSDAINKLENKNILTKIFLGSTLPFKKVPLNLVKTGFDYSPAGLITSSYKMIKALQGAEVKGAKVDVNATIDGVAKGITGTGVVLIGAVLRSLGYLTNGLSDDDKEANFEKLQGEQAFAIRLPNGDTYSLDFLQPAGMMLFSGAAIHDVVSDLLNKKGGEILEKDEDGNVVVGKSFSNITDIGINTIASFCEPMIEMSMLQNVKGILIDGNKTTVPQFIVDIIGDYANQFVPQFLSALSKTLDDTQRNPYYVDKTNNVPDMFEKHINVAKSKIPGLSQTLTEKVDNWGRTQKNNPNVALRAFENFISPGIYKESKTTEVDKYLNQLYVKTGDKSILPSNMAKNFSVDGEKTNLSAKQYAEAQKVKGQTAYNLVEDVMKNSVFKGLSAEEQASVISSIYQYSTAIAKSKVSNYEPTDWIAKASEAEKQGLEIDDYITLHKVKNNLKTTDEKSVSEQFLDQLYVTKISDEAKVAALEYIGGANVDKYRSAVKDPKDILALYDITSFDDAKEGQTEKDVDLEQIKKQFGTNIYDSREIYYKANDRWYNDYDEAIAGGDNRDKKAPIFTKFSFSEAEVTKGYNAVIGLNSKDDMLDALTYAFGSSKKATTFYNILKGKKGYK